MRIITFWNMFPRFSSEKWRNRPSVFSPVGPRSGVCDQLLLGLREVPNDDFVSSMSWGKKSAKKRIPTIFSSMLHLMISDIYIYKYILLYIILIIYFLGVFHKTAFALVILVGCSQPLPSCRIVGPPGPPPPPPEETWHQVRKITRGFGAIV